MAKKSLLYTALGLVVFAGGLGSGVSLASGQLKQVTADLAPFYWKAGDARFSAVDGYNDGTEQLPGSLNYKGTTYIPIRLLTETLGYEVGWDDATKTATILDPARSDDPASDMPAPSKTEYMPGAAELRSSAVMLAQADKNAAVLETLTAGTKVDVTAETSRDWLAVAVNGRTGYVAASATDYRFKADRPAWEQKADDVIAAGLKHMGAPYEFGASSKQTDTFDCSSFTRYIFGQNGVTLPRDSRQQSQTGQDVKIEDVRRGDLLFFTTPQRKNEKGLQRIGHVAVYLGDNKLLHTYRVGIGVTVTELDSNWKGRIVSAKRVISS
ncbi:NlpC/P60 family protein [Paenibacillus thalictri]|nr:NlpC/P60 family protein [Paenibacillus thalictri]